MRRGCPGMEGGHALADVLLGHVNPSGRLPCSFAQRDEDPPAFDKDAESITYDRWHGYRKLDRNGATPAFPLGLGLGYSTFALRDLQVDASQMTPDGRPALTVEVANTAPIAGEEVVQLYVSATDSCVERAPRKLKAFAKAMLTPGESRQVCLSVPASELA